MLDLGPLLEMHPPAVWAHFPGLGSKREDLSSRWDWPMVCHIAGIPAAPARGDEV